MTRVNSINTQQENPTSVFGSISKGIVGGAITGYAAKYMLPLNSSEMDDEYKAIISEIRVQSNKTKGLPIEAIRNLEQRTPAQDVFMKMIDSEASANNNGGLVRNVIKKITNQTIDNSAEQKRAVNMRKIIKNANLGENDMKELRNIIAQVNDKARSSCKRYISAYNSTVKSMKRPSIAFVTMGAVAGFFAGLVHKVITGQMDNI